MPEAVEQRGESVRQAAPRGGVGRADGAEDLAHGAAALRNDRHEDDWIGARLVRRVSSSSPRSPNAAFSTWSMRSVWRAIRQVLALEPLHRQVGLVRLVDPVRHIGDDVRVVEFA